MQLSNDERRIIDEDRPDRHGSRALQRPSRERHVLAGVRADVVTIRVYNVSDTIDRHGAARAPAAVPENADGAAVGGNRAMAQQHRRGEVGKQQAAGERQSTERRGGREGGGVRAPQGPDCRYARLFWPAAAA